MTMKVVVYGNPADGFRIVGPFTHSEATRYIEFERDSGSDWWIMDLDAPEAR